MIKVILKNGVQVECDTPQEASQLIHKTYWKDFSGGGAEKKAQKPKERKHRVHSLAKDCIVCGTPLKGYSQLKKYCDDCKLKVARQSAIQYYLEKKNRVPVTVA